MWPAVSSKLRRVAAIALLVGVLLSGGARESSAGEIARPDPRFGAVEAFWAPEQAVAAGVGWERILFYWSEIQPNGPDDWNTLHVREEWLAEAAAGGREVVGVLKQTPLWATDGRTQAGVPRGLELPVEHPDNLWAGYVRRVARYYGPRGVHHWVIWNEPDIAPGVFGFEFAGDVETYYRLLKVASIVLRIEDPEAVVHLAGLTYWHDVEAGREQYLRRLLEVATRDPGAAARGYYFDVVSLHIYFRAESVPTILAEMRGILADYGLEKPIWINETNAAPDRDPEWPVRRPGFPVDLEQQAWFLIQAHALGFAAGAERIGVYKFTDVLIPPGEEPYGLLRADFGERPAYGAYRRMTTLLAGYTEVAEVSDDPAAYHAVRFAVPGGRVTVLWARTAEGLAVHVPGAAGEARLVGWDGGERLLRPAGRAYVLVLRGARCEEECLMGGPPLFLVERLEPETDGAAPALSAAVTPVATAVIGAVSAPDRAVAAPAGDGGVADVLGPGAVATPVRVEGGEVVVGEDGRGTTREGAGAIDGAGIWLLLAGMGAALGLAWWWRRGAPRGG